MTGHGINKGHRRNEVNFIDNHKKAKQNHCLQTCKVLKNNNA